MDWRDYVALHLIIYGGGLFLIGYVLLIIAAYVQSAWRKWKRAP